MDDGDPVEDKALEASILGEATAMWQAIALRFRPAFLIRLPFRGGTQEADVTALKELNTGGTVVLISFMP